MGVVYRGNSFSESIQGPVQGGPFMYRSLLQSKVKTQNTITHITTNKTAMPTFLFSGLKVAGKITRTLDFSSLSHRGRSAMPRRLTYVLAGRDKKVFQLCY